MERFCCISYKFILRRKCLWALHYIYFANTLFSPDILHLKSLNVTSQSVPVLCPEGKPQDPCSSKTIGPPTLFPPSVSLHLQCMRYHMVKHLPSDGGVRLGGGNPGVYACFYPSGSMRKHLDTALERENKMLLQHIHT